MEEAEGAVREVHECCDDDQRNNPVPKLVQHRKARADEELDEVITSPINNGRYGEASGTGESGFCGRN